MTFCRVPFGKLEQSEPLLPADPGRCKLKSVTEHPRLGIAVVDVNVQHWYDIIRAASKCDVPIVWIMGDPLPSISTGG